jgi:hypothetical protein
MYAKERVGEKAMDEGFARPKSITPVITGGTNAVLRTETVCANALDT